MLAMTPGIAMETSTQGGMFKGLKRAVLGGESFFMNTYTSQHDGSELYLAPALSGDIVAWPLQGTLFVQSGSYLASSSGIEVDTKWGGGKTFFSSEGLFMLRIAGQGDLLLSSYGAIHAIDLQAGQIDHGRHRPHGRLDRRHQLQRAQGRQLEVHALLRRGPRLRPDRARAASTSRPAARTRSWTG